MQDIICECNKGINPEMQEKINYLADTFKKMGQENLASKDILEECPSCHEKTLIHQGGCIQCNSCGYSKCN